MITHGMSRTDTYKIWVCMVARCTKPSNTNYKTYGAKGITVCKEWQKDFMTFFRDMGTRPKGKELDRIDGSKGYCKENCRWVTKKQNLTNRILLSKYGLPRGVVRNGSNFQARFWNGKKNIHLGTFKTVYKAKRAYLTEYKKVYGELPPEERIKP